MSSAFSRGIVTRIESFDDQSGNAPIVARSDHHASSVFRPENMLREARRQKNLPPGTVPATCFLDPDGDIVRYVRVSHAARPSPHWACYHTDLWEWEQGGERFGVVGSAVGASFAVLVAEQLFVSGCELLISIASAGQILENGPPPYHILIERALRDEGTSYHYLPPSVFAEAEPGLLALASDAILGGCCVIHRGTTWTTDAPFRETAEAIEAHRRAGILAVEMEAAALYAFAAARSRAVLCLAHVTNQLGQIEGDFEKGDRNGACSSLDIAIAICCAWLRARRDQGTEPHGTAESNES